MNRLLGVLDAARVLGLIVCAVTALTARAVIDGVRGA